LATRNILGIHITYESPDCFDKQPEIAEKYTDYHEQNTKIGETSPIVIIVTVVIVIVIELHVWPTFQSLKKVCNL
jgi:hypothetical protein